MNQIIINADDCGMSTNVNRAIDEAITKGLITSTTIMANMYDFDGAVKIYNKWKDRISFGVHLNITEGHPIKYSQVMFETGFCVPDGDDMVFNRLHYLYRYPSKKLKNAIRAEMRAQIEKIMDSGIKISHIDSHRHMHIAPFILPIVCDVAREYGILKMRHSRNRLGFSLRDFKERGLNMYRNIIMRGIKTTDVFSSVSEYLSVFRMDDKIYELMCHPGHSNPQYVNEMVFLEERMMQQQNLGKMINYNDL